MFNKIIKLVKVLNDIHLGEQTSTLEIKNEHSLGELVVVWLNIQLDNKVPYGNEPYYLKKPEKNHGYYSKTMVTTN